MQDERELSLSRVCTGGCSRLAPALSSLAGVGSLHGFTFRYCRHPKSSRLGAARAEDHLWG